MTGSGGHAAANWCGVDAVVAAYAGTRVGLDAFTRACHALQRALPESRIFVLCPADARPRDDNGVDGVIEYPSPSVEPATDQAALEETLRAVETLAARGVGAAIVFAESGIAPYAPAYLCYLAGIAYRAGFEAEFGGAVLSPSLPLSERFDDGERHRALLAAVGLEPCRRPGTTSPSAEPSANRSVECGR